MADWISKGMSAEVGDHRIEINGDEAVVSVGTEYRAIYSSPDDLRELAALYAEAVQHMTGTAPAEPVKLAAGMVFEEPPMGTYVKGGPGDFWRREADGDWHMWGHLSQRWIRGGHPWADVCGGWSPLTVIDMNDPDAPWN